ncbi:MAG: FKBP-type peptidyl-prolyl cis-trans isomerase [Planctomycetaceae bacterium]
MVRRRPSQDRSRRRSRDLILEPLEGRQMLSANVAVASDAGEASSPLVRLIDAESGVERASVMAFESTFRGGVRVAMGRVTGNAAPDVVVGSGSGRVAEVRVFKPLTVGSTTTLTQVLSFRPFGDAYRGGIEVVVGNVDGDANEDIVVSKSRDGGDVKVFRVTNPGGTTTVTPYATIVRPFGPTYNGGSSVGVADVGEFANGAFVKSVGDNRVEVLVGSGAGMPARVRVYDMSRPATPRVADAFSPFGPLFQGGVSVTSGRYAASGVADSVDDIFVSAGRGGASQMRVFDGTVSAAANTVLKAFAPYAGRPRSNAAVFAAAVDVDGNGQVDGFRTTQGDPGAPAGISTVSVAGVRSADPLASIAAPLRIAAARTVFATQTINGTVANPSPTAGIAAGASRPMQVREIVTGAGATAGVGQTLTVQYTGMLTNGTVFDTSRQPGRTPFQFTVGQGQVIAGWEAGFVGMKVGGRRLLEIPPELAYGDAGRTNIPARSTLVFDVELVSVSGNGTASISGTSTGALTEDGLVTQVGGTLTVTDPEAGQAVFAAPGSLNKTYGTFSFNATTGVWGYTIDNSRSVTQALKAGQVVTDSLTVTSLDGTASKVIVVTITGAADAPTDIALSAAVVAENAAVGTVVGTLSTTDVDAGDTFTYALVPGDGATDNAAFTIAGAVLRTASAFDFETKSSYSIRVRSTDASNLSVEKVLAVTVTNVSEGPVDIGISAATVAENAAVGTTVGTLSTTHLDAGSAFTYTLVPGTGAADNAAFTIAGAVLKTATTFDVETKNSYSIRVRSTDAASLFTEKVLTVTVTNVNETATIGGTSTAALSADGPVVTVGNTLTISDPDAGQAAFAEPDSLDGTYGTFTFVAASGQWEYTLDPTRLNTLLLTADQTVTDSLTVTSLDGTASRTITVTITGYTMLTRSAVVATPSPSASVPAGTVSTLRYRDYAVGTGDVADAGDLLMVNYIGRLVDGTLFDSSLLPNRDPFEFQLGVGQVIRGWDVGVEGMRVGGVRVLQIPPELAYGDSSQGAIPSGATLMFVVEMLVATGPG